jgi:chorismate mutase
MHKLTDFVNNKMDIWSRKCEILKSTHDLLNRVESENKGSNNMVTLEVEIRVSTDLQEVIPTRVRISRIYL